MSIRETIIDNWSDLDVLVKDWAIRTKRVPLDQWELCEDGNWYETVTAVDADAALQVAESNVDRSNYADAETDHRTLYVDVRVHNKYTDEERGTTVDLEPDEPDCVEGGVHEWKSPWGHGGGVIIKEVCAHCGTYKITDTWAQNPSNGEQGLTSVAYEDADDDSRAWLWRRLARRAQDVEVDAAYTIKRNDDDQTVRLVRDEDGESLAVTDDELRAVADSQSWAAVIEQLPEHA